LITDSVLLNYKLIKELGRMCEKKLTYGIELEGYVDENIRGNYVQGWNLIDDGSLEDENEECEYCNGSGEFVGECSTCRGSGNIDCDNCSGEGYTTCCECDGNYELECKDCDGHGVIDEDGESIECGECDGTGIVHCEHCEEGYDDCDDCCRGQVDCDDCNGHGEITEECCECEGEGSHGDGDKYGVECVSNIIVEGEYDYIDRIFDYIGNRGWNVDDSCGTHVHIGGHELEPKDLSKLAILVNILEPMIYGSMDKNRLDGSYCRRVKADMVEYLIERGEEITLQEIANQYYGFTRNLNDGFSKYEQQRYFGLNLHSWFFRKTIEFRYFEGAEDRDQAKQWIDFCTKLVNFAKYTTFEQLIVIGKDFYAVDNLTTLLERMEELLGLEYNFRPCNQYTYRIARNNIVNSLRTTSSISEAI
jgi:hypothetical protein